jgi:hypothetical protein
MRPGEAALKYGASTSVCRDEVTSHPRPSCIPIHDNYPCACVSQSNGWLSSFVKYRSRFEQNTLPGVLFITITEQTIWAMREGLIGVRLQRTRVKTSRLSGSICRPVYGAANGAPIDDARRDCVDADALRAQRGGEILDQCIVRALGRRIGRQVADRRTGGQRRDQDYARPVMQQRQKLLDEEIGRSDIDRPIAVEVRATVCSAMVAEPATALATTMSSLLPTIAFTSPASLTGLSGWARSARTASALPPLVRISLTTAFGRTRPPVHGSLRQNACALFAF